MIGGTMKRSLVLLAALGALVVAGCGSDKKDKSTSASKPAPAASSTTAASGSDIAVSMKNIQFNPKAIQAKVGQTIKWTNDDSVEHNVTATKGEDFKSKNFGQGQSYSYKVD